ncbi:hypothetical protein [Allorhizocola rhizosphaerae]|uniref:hypothetical protein n=1 Tax=Allorhizocola rhizosphaerae TaxID=1872709 RepID=UPI0013C31258|nr:hypothetical protein [Allorhizocola rhizosphaerae]
MDAKKERTPAWVDSSAPPKLWINLHQGLPWLKDRPYLVDRGQAAELRSALQGMGFTVVEAMFAGGPKDAERAFLVELTSKLRLNELGAGNWAAFNDRLWDFLKSEDATAVAVVIDGLDRLVDADIYTFVRCIHNLLSLTEGAGLTDSAANRQIEYFFIGDWSRSGDTDGAGEEERR